MVNINIVRCFTFSNNVLISNNQQLNNKAFESLSKEQKIDIINNHFPIGYEIQNITRNSVIENIKIPEYTIDKKNNNIIGEIKEVSLKSEEFLILPTKYLMLLLFEQKNDLLLANGRMIQFIKGINSDLDTYLNNFIFSAGPNWEELVDPLKNVYWYRNISYFHDMKNGKPINFKIIEPEMIKLFGNYNKISQNIYTFNNNLNDKNNIIFLNEIMGGNSKNGK